MRVAISISMCCLALACGSSSPPPPSAAERRVIAERVRGDLALTVRVRELRSNDGHVSIALFASERGFPGSAAHAARAGNAELRDGTAELEMKGLAPGTYAVAVLHDENANGALDTGFLGIPSEGLGASNAAQGRFGPADFEDAKFTLDDDRVIDVGVRYFP